MAPQPDRYDSLGRGLQLLGLIVLPMAMWHGVQGGNLYDELLFAGMGVGLFMVGRSLRGPGA